MNRNAPRATSLRHTQNDIPEVAKTPKEMRMTAVGDMLPFGEGGETAARANKAPALLREGDMVDVMKIESGSSGNYAPF